MRTASDGRLRAMIKQYIRMHKECEQMPMEYGSMHDDLQRSFSSACRSLSKEEWVVFYSETSRELRKYYRREQPENMAG